MMNLRRFHSSICNPAEQEAGYQIGSAKIAGVRAILQLDSIGQTLPGRNRSQPSQISGDLTAPPVRSALRRRIDSLPSVWNRFKLYETCRPLRLRSCSRHRTSTSTASSGSVRYRGLGRRYAKVPPPRYPDRSRSLQCIKSWSPGDKSIMLLQIAFNVRLGIGHGNRRSRSEVDPGAGTRDRRS